MKRSGKRLLAVLLCLAMVMTLLPVSALARWDDAATPEIPAEQDGKAAVKAELPMDAAGDDVNAELSAGTIPSDGATADTWVQIEASKVTGSVDPVKEDGKIVLSSVAANGNNLDGDNPAIFVDTDMNKTLSALDGSAEKTLSFTLTPSSSGSWMGFGLMLNYDGTTGSAVKAYYIGYPSGETTGWFTQNYGATSVYWPGFTGPDMVAGEPVDFEIKWSDTGVSSFKIGGQSMTLSADYDLTTVPAVTDDGSGLTGVAFKVGTRTDTTTIRLSNVHYTGQATVSVYDVSGKVTDSESGEALAGVEVTAGSYTATTNAQGNYTLENLVAGTYTLTFTKTGYKQDGTQSVEVSNADVTKNVTMTASDAVEIPKDGVNNGDWTQVAGMGSDVTGTTAPAVEDGRLVLTSGNENGHKIQGTSVQTALFTSAKLNEELAAFSGDTKTLSFTLTPESVHGPGTPDYLAFGVVINSNESNQGTFIGYSDVAGDKWLFQNYGGNGKYVADAALTAPTAGVPIKFEITWTDNTLTMKVNGESVNLGNVAKIGAYTEGSESYVAVPVTNKIAFCVGGNKYVSENGSLQNDRQTRIRISDLHYSGQETVDARYVKGTVTCGGKAVAGATVSVQGDLTDTYTQITDEAGKYSVALPIRTESYTLSATKDGYDTVNKTVAVTVNAEKSTLESVNFALTELPTISGTVKDSKGKAILGAVVKSDLRPENAPAAVTDASGKFTVIGAVDGKHTLTVSAEGYETTTKEVTVAGQNVTGVEITLEDRQIPSYTLSTEDMDVTVAQAFPQTIKYTLKKLLDTNGQPKTMHGQTAELNTIKINGVEVIPTVTSVLDETTNKKVTYTMVIDDSNNATTGVTATITAELRVGLEDVNEKTSEAAGRTLGFYITGVEYANDSRLAHPIKTIEIPNHSLVSVRSTEAGAAVTGATLADNTITSGDVTYEAANNIGYAGSVDFFAGFVYNDKLSASLASNSAYGTSSAGSNNNPVRAQFEAKDGGESVSIGLGSTLWYYDYDITASESGSMTRLTTTQLPLEKRIIAPLDMPYAKVVIADDRNDNGKVDWQDGAIAYRETVMHIPVGGEQVANTANLRISMNFGSMATNPFLIALDNVKRVSAHTDGLGQFVLLKGYAGEGHDSNHPQYDNIGIRMGGPDDLKTLLEEGEKLGAAFGIHTNASEFYAEAITNEDQVLRWSNGGMKYGWNWLDQGISINAVYDQASGLRKARWDKLYDIVKGYPFTVYVDVWGNNTSGTEDAFLTRALSNEILKDHDGWRIAHEWAWANPYESTFQHWTTDYTYGSYSDKGKLNSNVLRFILNEYKDSFPADFATFGGAANAPLLGGPAMQGFEGWQGDGEYNLSIYNTFNQMVATKFLQHYDIMEWSNATQPTLMWWWVDAKKTNKTAGRTVENDDGTITLQNQNSRGGWDNYGGTTLWTPENQIKLQSADGKQTIVVTRGTDQIPDAHYSYEDGAQSEVVYRSRVITLNGKEILRGAPASAGEDTRFPASKATLQYLIPWYWKVDGTQVDAADEKLYHWNAKGGQSTWELPDGWGNLATVVLYELSDQGRDAGKTVKVIDGKITLSGIKADTGYVVTKGADAKNAPVIEYGTGLHLGDPSFNMDTARKDNPWTITGKGSAIHTTNSDGIGVLKMTGEVAVSQIMTDLKPGTTYVSYVAVDNRSNAKASMTITDETGEVVATNYTMRSIAKNYVSSYYLHNGHGVEAGGSYFQNMFVYFTPEAGKTYTMTLSREAGSGNVYFDDLRTVEYGFNYARSDGSPFGGGQTAQNEKGSAELPVTYDSETGAVTALHQDFENVPQGIWPFVVGPVEGVADNRSHVSELNAPFTQAGWDVKKMDDVIDGNWSIKINGLCGSNNLVYQTIPQNFRFEADKVYTVSFDYELGTAGAYLAVVGDGAYTNLDSLTVYNLEQTLKTTVPTTPNVTGKVNKADVGHIEFTVVGSKSGQTWIGIYSKNDSNNQGTSGDAAAFGGYKDFVLDNLTIELAPAEKNELALLLQEADTMVETSYISAVEGTSDADAWSAFETARDDGQAVFDNDSATTEQVTDAVDALKTAMESLEKVNISISGTVKNANNKPVAGVVLTLEDSEYIPVGLEVTTGDDGAFTFVSKSGVELIPATYRIKAQATGYNVMTTDGIELTKADAAKTKDIVLEAEAPGAYVNDFNNGDIGMMGFLVPNDTPNLPTLETTEFDGSGALKITWNANSGETRHINNIVDKTMTMANGSFSFDVTPLTNNGIRFGITFRGQEGDENNANRVFVGQEDGVKQWFVEYWNDDTNRPAGTTANSYIAKSEKDIGLDCNVTRNVRAVIDGTSFQVYVDGVKIYDVNASALAGMPTAAGYVGFNMRLQGGSEYIIDNLRIISADAAEGVQNVSGTITASGEAVSGAAVDLYQGDTRVAGTSTNALGAYQISRVEPGSYTLKVSAPFFQEKSKTITVASADLTGQNFTLVLDLTSLTTLFAEVEALNEEDYTEETWADLVEALDAAKEIDADSSIAALNTAYRDLSNAKEALVISEKATADFSELRDLHKEMANKPNDNYTNSTWNAFQEALEAARQVLLAGTATQEEVDTAKEALQDAYDALDQATPADEMDLTALEAAYNAAKDVEKGSATDANWAKFVDARDAALAILSNADGLKQADVDAATKALTDAQSGLRRSGGTTSPASTTTTETREDGSKVTTVTKPDGTVTETVAQPDGTKSETVTTPEGDTTITVTDPDGEELVKTEIPATIPEPEDKFVDIDQTPWAVEAINNVAGLKLVNGIGGNKYDPTTPMTRGSLATVLYRLSQGKSDYKVAFKDVLTNRYYTEGVAWAAKAKVVTGYTTDIFAPDDIITREQLAVMMARYAKLIGMDTKADTKSLDAFVDGENTGAWAVDGVAWCVENGILRGKGLNNLDPTANVSRAEVAVMLDRFIALIQK